MKVEPFTRYNAKQVHGFKGKPKDNLYYGVELEYETQAKNRNVNKTAREVNDILGDFCIIKHDGSLNYGFELNSAPATLGIHKKNWNKFFEDPVREKLRVSRGDCGMHVHVSRKGLQKGVSRKIASFIYNEKNKEFLVDIAGRECDDYASYDRANQCDGDYKYQALNVGLRDTIEFRIFKSTYNKFIFLYRMEFVAAIIEFCTKYQTKHLLFKNFIDFIGKNGKKYPNLKKYIKSHELWKNIASNSYTEAVEKYIPNRKNLKTKKKSK